MISTLKPAILHIDNSAAVTGAYKALSSWCLSAPEYRHVWVLPEGSAVAEEARKHFTVYTLPFVEIGRSPAKLVRYLPALFINGRRLKKIILEEQPRLLHANDLYNLTPYAAQVLSGKRLPLAVHARMLRRSFPGRIYDFWKRWHLQRADAVLAVSEAIREDWNNDARVTVAYDPIQITELLPPYQFERKTGETFRFLYLSNYIQGKGQDDALQAVRQLKEEGVSGFRVDFYGGTMGLEKNEAYRQQMQAFITTHGLQEYITLNGPVVDVEATIKGYHAALHFSHAESFGMVCYEALHYGLPVISADCGGPKEMMQPGKSGILLPVGDIAAFAKAMKRLMSDDAWCRTLSREAPAVLGVKIKNGSYLLKECFDQLIARS